MVEEGAARRLAAADALVAVAAGEGQDLRREQVGVRQDLLDPLDAVQDLDETGVVVVRAILPARANTFVPLLFSVPMEAYQAPPFFTIGATLAKVSTLLMRVGWPHRPLMAG